MFEMTRQGSIIVERYSVDLINIILITCFLKAENEIKDEQYDALKAEQEKLINDFKGMSVFFLFELK